MTTHNEKFYIPNTEERTWKLGGGCSMSSQHQAQCWECGEMKLCWGLPIDVASCCGPVADPVAYYCDECKKKVFEKDTATVSVEKANGKS
tara:strand:- start:9560 stop:9829 length:270 start_codon:yes stop_codon:yes gene_type:complete